ncbi:MAG: endopeptidase La [Thermodesulfobacteriota bacterium]|jgi:ATP-dependent Lon protease
MENNETSLPLQTQVLTIPEEIPLLPVVDVALFPKMVMPLMIWEKNWVQLVDEALMKDHLIGLVMVQGKGQDPLTTKDLYSYGTVGSILKMAKVPEGGVRLMVQGLSRFKIEEFTATNPYFKARIEILKDLLESGIETDALLNSARGLFIKVLDLSPYLPAELGLLAQSVEDPGSLADMVTSTLNIPKEDKQDILETLEVKQRLQKITVILTKELEVLELGKKIQSEVKEGIDKTQREYYLREQLKAIQKELGEKDEKSLEIDEYRKKIVERGLSPAAAKEAERELDRLSRMNPASPEYTVTLSYLDWLTELPWQIHTEDNLDIEAAAKVLDDDHFDLEKVKKRVLEYLAVRKLKPDMKGPILCFAGPPGTGKTSLGRSIARALGRKFVRLSLGGVRDEAEIRGHRRTYVGALPGRIIQGLKKAGSNNPVFILDEIDKVGADFRGDPSSALLEVLDPEQNSTFSDHYLEVEFDLSKVMFITTANILDTIPPALRDRMEVLDLSGYIEEEKIQIAQKHLIPKQLSEHGLSEKILTFNKKALQVIIRSYTREAGLRNLEREIASLCRGVAKEVAEGKIKSTKITEKDLHQYLGPVHFFSEIAERTQEPGVATGLAWTQSGGDILFVEATKMPGRRTMTLTGQLGEVMKESAGAALSYIRSKAGQLGIPEDFYENNDLHIHVPAGAIPKDGPSAGTAIMTALTSLLTNRPIRGNLAMTGEITLRGLVLPVGGIKEKVLAAKRAGIVTVILPKKNEKDLEEIPPHLKKGLKFHFVERMDEVIDLALYKNSRACKK